MRTKDPNITCLVLGCRGAGASTLTITDGAGLTSVSREGVGEYTLTLSDTWQSVIGAQILVNSLDGVAAIAGKAVIASFSSANKTLPIEFWDLATPSAIDPAANSYVTIVLWMKSYP